MNTSVIMRRLVDGEVPSMVDRHVMRAFQFLQKIEQQTSEGKCVEILEFGLINLSLCIPSKHDYPLWGSK